FFIGLLLILLLQLAAGILGAAFKSESSRLLNETLHENAKLLAQSTPEAKELQQAMISLQTELKCCGLVYGAQDWGDNFNEARDSCKCPDT
ncbi:hypothetical protein A6R68_19568, partial [Neotoma lepida]